MTIIRSALTALALALPLLASPLAATAQTQEAEEDPVVARVNGAEIRRSEVFAFASTLPAQYQTQILQIYPLLVQRLVDFKLASVAGREAGLADDAKVKARLAELEDRVIREAWFEQAINDRVTDDSLQDSYKDYVAANPPAQETRARHILLETEVQAREIITKLDGGADFAELAKEHSTGPSGAQGGDLGYFTKDQMVPEFSAAAGALEPGQHSKDPTQTQFGWHVIKVEDRRDSAPPGFEQVAPQLREELARGAVEEALEQLRQASEIEITPEGTAMVPEGDAPQPPQATQPAEPPQPAQ